MDSSGKNHWMEPSSLKNTMMLSRVTFVGLVVALVWMAVISSLHWERIREEEQTETHMRMWPFTLVSDAGAFARYPPTGYIRECKDARQFTLCCLTPKNALVCNYGRGSTPDTLECYLQRERGGYYAMVYANHPSLKGSACRLYCN